MKPEDIKPGLYRLVRDVTNPYPDGRTVYDWRGRDVWKAGTVVYARPSMPDSNALAELYVTSKWSHQSLPVLREEERRAARHTWPKVKALLEAMEPATPRTIGQALEAAGVGDWLEEAVERLVRDGRLTYADILAAASAERDAAEGAQPDDHTDVASQAWAHLKPQPNDKTKGD